MTIVYVLKRKCCTKNHLKYFKNVLHIHHIPIASVKFIYQEKNKPKVIQDSADDTFYKRKNKVVIVTNEVGQHNSRKIKSIFRSKYKHNGMHSSDSHSSGNREIRNLLNVHNDLLYIESQTQRNRLAKYSKDRRRPRPRPRRPKKSV